MRFCIFLEIQKTDDFWNSFKADVILKFRNEFQIDSNKIMSLVYMYSVNKYNILDYEYYFSMNLINIYHRMFLPLLIKTSYLKPSLFKKLSLLRFIQQ